MRGVQAEMVEESGPPAAAILRVAEQRQSDVILMGGYGVGPLLNVFFDDVVDQILRAWQRPMFICR
jgi:nucleotide-binding universal stress UspA family protein